MSRISKALDITEWSTRSLIVLLTAVTIGLVAVSISGCADVERMHPMLKRMLDDKDKYSF